MGVVAYLVYRVLGDKSNTLGVICAIVAALIVYFIIIFALRTLTDEELALMPGGGRLRRIAAKFGRRGR